MLMRHVDHLFKRGTSEEEVAEHSRKAFVQAIRRENTRMELLADFCIVLGEEGLNTACKEASNTLTEEAAYYSVNAACVNDGITPLYAGVQDSLPQMVDFLLRNKATGSLTAVAEQRKAVDIVTPAIGFLRVEGGAQATCHALPLPMQPTVSAAAA